MKVWAVFAQFPFEGDDIRGIFSTRELADSFVARLEGEQTDPYALTTYLVEEFLVDAGV